MKIFKIALLTSLLVIAGNAIAQNTATVTGSVKDKNSKAVSWSTVSLLHANDSSVVKLSAADREGAFTFEKITIGKYVIVVSAVGYEKSYSAAFSLDGQQPERTLTAIILSPLNNNISAVTVTAKRPLIEQRIDRTIIHVDASIMNIGTSALEVLEKSPGVTVDRDGNISLKGKEGVLVLVDGRPTQLSGTDLANLLRGMSSSQLDQVEIMTNPPARYDAGGNAGIINLKMKKIITAGVNGNAGVTYSQGRYPKTSESFNFNYRTSRVNIFTALSHNYQQRFQTLDINRKIFSSNGNSIENILVQQNKRMTTTNSYNGKIGLDFFANKKTTLGAFVNFNSRLSSTINPTLTSIFDAAGNPEGSTTAMLNNKNDWNSANGNINFRRLLNTKGRELTADIDLVKYTSANAQLLVNAYEDINANPSKKPDTLKASLPQDVQVYSARVDYVHPFKKDGRLEAGFKSSIVRTDNNAVYDSIISGQMVHDYNRSNHFVYEENIHAAYVTASTSLSEKLETQIGLRLENTVSNGRQKTTGENFERNYTQLFPTAYFQYKLNDRHTISANYGRRVRRPGYQALNPFTRFIDRYTYSRGNPYLKPSLSNNIELTHSWKDLVTTTVNYTHTKDIMSEVTEQKGREAYNMVANVSSSHQIGISVGTNIPVTRWWASMININTYTDRYKGTVSSAPVNVTGTTFLFNGTQQFKITKTLSAELNGMYRNGGLEGLVRVKHVGYVGAGLSKKVMKNQGTIRLSARDIFHTQRLSGASRYSNVDLKIRQVSETQVVSIGFSYSFSKGKRNAPVKRTEGSANEEQGRMAQ